MALSLSRKVHPPEAQDWLDLASHTQERLPFTASVDQSPVFTRTGFYDVWADQDVYIKVAETANDVTVLTGYLLRAGNTITLWIRGSDHHENFTGHRIGAIRASSDGTLSWHGVG